MFFPFWPPPRSLKVFLRQEWILPFKKMFEGTRIKFFLFYLRFQDEMKICSGMQLIWNATSSFWFFAASFWEKIIPTSFLRTSDLNLCQRFFFVLMGIPEKLMDYSVMTFYWDLDILLLRIMHQPRVAEKLILNIFNAFEELDYHVKFIILDDIFSSIILEVINVYEEGGGNSH